MNPLNLPTNLQDQNALFKSMLQTNTVIQLIVDMWKDLVFKGRVIQVTIPNLTTARFYIEVIDASGIERQFPVLLGDYLTFGRFVTSLVFSETKGYWTDCIVQDLNRVQITHSPVRGEAPSIEVHTSEEQQEWATSSDPRVVEQREVLDPELIKLMAEGLPIELEPENTLFLARETYTLDFLGTSYLSKIAELLNEEVTEVEPLQVLYQLNLDSKYLEQDSTFETHFVKPANRLREKLTDYVLKEKMLSHLAKTHNLPTPEVGWAVVKQVDPKEIVRSTFVKIGLVS